MNPIKAIRDKPNIDAPTQAYTMTFVGEGSSRDVTVDPNDIPYGSTGLPGSILDIALSEGVELGHVCGGVAACSTCHVKVKEGIESCNEASDAELDQLDEAPNIALDSRLGCQCVPDGTTDIVVEIPGREQESCGTTARRGRPRG
jgi:2Fe-2S ferredoxin